MRGLLEPFEGLLRPFEGLLRHFEELNRSLEGSFQGLLTQASCGATLNLL